MSDPPTEAPGAPPREPEGPRPPLRLLVVDDDEVDRLIVRRRLREAAVEAVVDEAPGTREAMAKLEGAGEYDCLLLDYNIPGGDGLELLRAARRLRPDQPVVMLTGQGDEEVAVRLMKSGASDYLPKASLTADRLATSLRYAVELARAQAAARRAEDEVVQGAVRARFLAEASEVLARSLETQPTLERVAQLAVPVLGDYCLVYLVDEAGRAAGVASAHRDPAQAPLARVITDRYRPAPDHPASGVAAVLRTGRTGVAHFDDAALARLTDDPGVLQALRGLEPRVALYVALRARGAVTGCMAFARGPGRPAFAPDEVRLAEDLAARTAVALENARLYQDAERARDRTERLQRVTALLAAALPRDEVAHLFVTHVREAFDADTAWVALLDPEGAALRTVAHAGFSDEGMRPFAHLTVGDPMPSTDVLRTGQGVWFPSKDAVLAAYPALAPLAEAVEQEAVMLEPLDAGAGPFGMMALGFRDRRELSREDRELGLAMARQFAQALERARLFEAERESRAAAERLARRLADAALAIAREPTLQGVLDQITEQARRVVGAHQAVTSLTTGEAMEQTINAVSLSDRYAAWRDYTVQPDGLGIYHLVARTNRAMRMTQAELEAHPAWRGFGPEARRHPPMRGWLAVPLVARDGHNIGLIQLSDRAEGEFTAADEAILVQLAQMAAAAVENVQLYDTAQAARAEAEEANRAKSQFLARMSHDLRTPLNAIGGYAQLLEMEVHGPVSEAQRGAIGRIVRAQEHLLALINDILSFARLEAGQVRIEEEDIAVRETLLELGALVRPDAERRGIDLRIETGAAGVRARGDGERLMQVLTNLTSNALKFTPEGGQVGVEAHPEAEWVHIRVRDTGIGIPAARLEAIFDPFVQGRDTAEERREGVGLGLAISRELTRMMGGDLRVESEEGRGSTFVVRLPRGTS